MGRGINLFERPGLVKVFAQMPKEPHDIAIGAGISHRFDFTICLLSISASLIPSVNKIVFIWLKDRLWSRFALPKASAWQDPEEPVRFVEQRWQKADPDAKALACYGVLWQRGPAEAPVRDQLSLRFVDGRPVSDITTQFLACCCTKLEAEGKRAWLLIWDNGAFHSSKIVRTWIRDHNQPVKISGKGVRILPLFLPTQSPWLNPIEPKWGHGKRAVVEPNGLLSAKQLAQRICAY